MSNNDTLRAQPGYLAGPLSLREFKPRESSLATKLGLFSTDEKSKVSVISSDSNIHFTDQSDNRLVSIDVDCMAQSVTYPPNTDVGMFFFRHEYKQYVVSAAGYAWWTLTPYASLTFGLGGMMIANKLELITGAWVAALTLVTVLVAISIAIYFRAVYCKRIGLLELQKLINQRMNQEA